MCRMVGFVAERPVAMRALLNEAPRNLSALSVEHPDGWGIAAKAEEGWQVEKGLACAARCDRFREAAERATSTLAIAHVRKKTVGGTSLANTHPFQRGRYVLAHNGTIDEAGSLLEASARTHADALEGQTDSERLFAFLLTRIDEAGAVGGGLIAGVRTLRRLRGRAAATFLFSDGERLFAYRQGRSLYALARERGTRSRTLTLASEPLTDEGWLEIPEHTLLALDPASVPRLEILDRAA